MWKWIRVSLLLIIFASVASNEWLTQRRLWSWQQPVVVAVYPLAGDASPETARYVRNLTSADFADIERFFREEAKRLALKQPIPLQLEVYPGLTALPPLPPRESQGLHVILWSLGLRFYAWRATTLGDGAIRVFVLYHDAARLPALPHSLGLRRGRIGVVHAFATPYMAGSNSVVVAHEILHALGATDRYDPATNLPLVPDGLGDPEQHPLYPQDYAEIMAGRRMLSPDKAETPSSLQLCLIGTQTAFEIHWLH